MKKEKNILITGESGFIGSHLIDFFVRNYSKYNIYGLDVLSYASNKKLTNHLFEFPNYFFEKLDIRNRDEIFKFFKKNAITDVINLAAESHVDNSISNPILFAETNIIGTINLLDAFKKYSSGRFHHVSTDEVFGDLGPNDKPFNEMSPYLPNSPYAASKASSDHFVRAYHKTFNSDVIITNCSNNFGPHQHAEKFIPTVINSIKNNKLIPIYGNGKNIRDWLYVKDHVSAIDLVFHNGISGNTYNIGANNELSNNELVSLICDIFIEKKYHDRPKELVSFISDRPGHDRRYAVDCNKIKKNLSWVCQYDFKQSLSDTIDWYFKKSD
tara:strand:- start:436 stop:1416 length:981 start_codon:yes stop_codon:yes gene_type:complete